MMRCGSPWLVALLFGLPAVARSETRLGAFAGPSSFSQVYSVEASDLPTLDSRSGFAAGLVVDVAVGRRLRIVVAPGWVSKGATLVSGFLPEEYFPAERRLGYVEVPVLLRVGAGTGAVRPYLTAGPSLGYLARQTIFRENEGIERDLGGLYARWDFGLSGGGGVELGSGDTRVFLEARYTWGLANVAAAGRDAATRNRGWQALVGVTLSIRH
jgi:hypothetical protein